MMFVESFNIAGFSPDCTISMEPICGSGHANVVNDDNAFSGVRV